MKVVLYQGALYSVLIAIQVIGITVKLLQSQCTSLNPRLFMFSDYTYIMICQGVWNAQETTDGNTVGVQYNFLPHIFMD